MQLPKGAQQQISQYQRNTRGLAWGDTGVILVSESNRLSRFEAEGGTMSPLSVPGLGEGKYYNPEFLPGGEDFLFTFCPRDSTDGRIFLAKLQGMAVANPQFLLVNDTSATFTPAGGGRILFVRQDNLYSQKLDLKARKLSGEPELLQEHVASFTPSRLAYFSVSRNGTIVWRSGTALQSQVTIFDRKGNRIGVAGSPSPIQIIRLSPDQSRLFAYSESASWIIDANGPTRTLFSPNPIGSPIWSSDGSHLITPKDGELWEIELAGRASRNLGDLGTPIGTAPDGHIVYGSRNSIFSVIPGSGEVPRQLVSQRADNAALSPDGNWIVYAPRYEDEILVKAVSGNTLPKQIATRGNFPTWRRDGKEILFTNLGNVYSVRVDGSGESLRFSAPELLFSAASPLGLNSGSRPLDVSRDGSRIYFLQSTEQPDSGVIQVRTNAIR